jgi:phage anti-repressor protein
LIPIRERDGPKSVSARDLHRFLGVETPYKLWHKRMFEYGFEENIDYVAVVQKSTTAQGNEYTFTDHNLTLDTAKEIAMLQRSEKGKQARRYFIEVEKQAKEMYKQLQAVEKTQQLSKQEIVEMIRVEVRAQLTVDLGVMIRDAVELALKPVLATLSPVKASAIEKPTASPSLFETDTKRSLSRFASKIAMIDSAMDANLHNYQRMFLPYYQSLVSNDRAIVYAYTAGALNVIVAIVQEVGGDGELFFEDVISVLKRRGIRGLTYTVRHLRNKVLSVIREGELITDVVTPPRHGNQNARKYYDI